MWIIDNYKLKRRIKQGKVLAVFILAVFMCLGLSSCASTQKERLAKLDSVFKAIDNKTNKILGKKSKVSSETKETKQMAANKPKYKPRSPLIHNFVYEASEADKFIFFYRGKDQNSKEFSKILKKYVDETNMKVIAYTADNRSSPSFPDSVLVTREIIEQYFGSSDANVKTPTLFLAQFDSYAVPITTGKISYLELINRMNKAAEERIARSPKKYGY